jgi:hypothetical protein
MADEPTKTPSELEPEKVYGALARASALLAGIDEWWKVTEWPSENPPSSTEQP